MWKEVKFGIYITMTKILLLLFCSMACLASCVDKTAKQTTSNTSNFQVFEISYTNGWTRGFSFLIDSSKVFIASTQKDSIEFGHASDSIFKFIDSTLFVIKNDTTIKTKANNCSDCSLVSLKAIINSDTIRIFQAGNDIDRKILPLVNKLKSFINNPQYTKVSAFNWETQQEVLPPTKPPPPL
jgi:hypothetical protein